MTDSGKTEVEAEHTLELYKLAFARLEFQDEYLFKFSTVFLTAHGALALLCRPPFSGGHVLSYTALTGASAVGFILAVIWCAWVFHNDHWHSVWVGAIKDIERKLTTSAVLFNSDHPSLAAKGGRAKEAMRGHGVAILLPLAIAFGWAITGLYAWASIPEQAQQAVQGDGPASGGSAP
jgi:hypothetical protein